MKKRQRFLAHLDPRAVGRPAGSPPPDRSHRLASPAGARTHQPVTRTRPRASREHPRPRPAHRPSDPRPTILSVRRSSVSPAKPPSPSPSHVRHVRATSPTASASSAILLRRERDHGPQSPSLIFPRWGSGSCEAAGAGWFRGPTMGTLIRPGPAASPLPIASSSSSGHGIADPPPLCWLAGPYLPGEATGADLILSVIYVLVGS